jgi:hypothetical protein
MTALRSEMPSQEAPQVVRQFGDYGLLGIAVMLLDHCFIFVLRLGMRTGSLGRSPMHLLHREGSVGSTLDRGALRGTR